MKKLFQKIYHDLDGYQITMFVYKGNGNDANNYFLTITYKRKNTTFKIFHDWKDGRLFDIFLSMVTQFSEDKNPPGSARAMYRKISTEFCPCCQRPFKTIRPLHQLENQLAWEKSKS
jgi:hypothetical protein